VIDKLSEIFPTRNYTRAIEIPRYIIPDPVNKLVSMTRERTKSILSQEIMQTEKYLSDTHGFLNIIKHEEQIRNKFKEIVECKNKSLALFLRKVDDMISEFDNQ
jgi:hypothetical protein